MFLQYLCLFSTNMVAGGDAMTRKIYNEAPKDITNQYSECPFDSMKSIIDFLVEDKNIVSILHHNGVVRGKSDIYKYYCINICIIYIGC